MLTAKTGFNTFELAVDADRQWEAYKISLRIEYDKLIRWGETTGLLSEDKDAAALYDQKMKSNGPLVVAILSQLDLELKDLRKDELKWRIFSVEEQKKLQNSAKQPGHQGEQGTTPKPGDITEPSQSVTKDGSKGQALAIGQTRPDARPDERSKFAEVLATQESSAVPSKYLRGLDRIRRLASGVVTVTKQPKRFEWALRGDEKFSIKLTRVQRLVRSLGEMLSHDQMTTFIKNSNDFKLDLLQLTTNVEQMKALLESQGRRSKFDGTTPVEVQTGQVIIANPPQNAEARFTAFLNAAIQFSIDMNDRNPSLSGSLELGSSDVQSLELGSVSKDEVRSWTHTMAGTYKWVEWKSYKPVSALNRDPSQDSNDRVRRLVMLLRARKKPDQFCVPPCMGYFVVRNQKKFGVVFEAPDAGDMESWPPSSLLDCFDSKGVPLPVRIAMAQQLSKWLLYLHAVNWLHKGIRSANVLFLSRKGSKDFGHPYVSGFEYSRVSEGDHTTTGPPGTIEDWAWYIHPDYLGSKRGLGFRKTYDMYSLGVVLVELAYWKPMRSVYLESLKIAESEKQAEAGAERDDHKSERTTTATRVPISEIEKLRSSMLNGEIDILDRIKEIAGTRYHKATRACLEGMPAFELSDRLNQTDPTVGAHIQRAFVKEVVDCLLGIVV